jgi:hypothetical protein
MSTWYLKSKFIEAVISPETAKRLKIEKELPDNETFIKAVENTGGRITEDGFEIEIMRNQHPDQDGQESLRSGVFYQPVGSHNKYPYSGKHGYGGTSKIKGLSLFRKPLFVKGATGGLAPIRAYDMLKFKGAYKNMRRQALNCSSYRTGAVCDKIEEFLEAYGGDVNMTEEFCRFSRIAKGNNLFYALQEHVVAHEVRRAGYDSIVGYSLKRDGSPFISEIFDLREKTYPSQFNQSDIHEHFVEI